VNKKVVFVGIGLLLMAGGGAFYGLERPRAATAAETSASSAESVPVRIPFLAVPIVAAGKLQRYVIVALTVDTPSQGDADAVKKDLPRVVDAILATFHHGADGQPLVDQADDEAALSARLQQSLKHFPDAAHIRGIVVSSNRAPPR
jgi:flagellar basal body-associated protein FliL